MTEPVVTRFAPSPTGFIHLGNIRSALYPWAFARATGGVFIIDDLGRQQEPPQKIVNRWIVPLEEARDILALQSGEKFTVPFWPSAVVIPTSS